MKRGTIVPIKSIGCHGPTKPGAAPFPFGLEPDVLSMGWRSQTLARLPGWAAERDVKALMVYLPFGSLNKVWPAGNTSFDPSTWRMAKDAGVEVANDYKLREWVGNMNSDGGCVPWFYLPPLPWAETAHGSPMTLDEWLEEVRGEALGFVEELLLQEHRFGLFFDTLGAAGKSGDRSRWYVYALIESLLREGVEVLGIEPPGEMNTLWHQFPELMGMVTPEYLLGNVAAKYAWTNPHWIVWEEAHRQAIKGISICPPDRRILVNMKPGYEQHEASMLANGYDILRPVHAWGKGDDAVNAAAAAAEGTVQP